MRSLAGAQLCAVELLAMKSEMSKGTLDNMSGVSEMIGSAAERQDFAVRNLLNEMLLADAPGATFSDEQWAAISAPLTPNVIIAGAGTGKTTVMKYRVCYLVLTAQVAANQVLGLTFTRKAAAELKNKITAVLAAAGLADQNGSQYDPTVATYDAFASDLIRRYGLLVGFEPTTRLLEGAMRFQLAEQVLTNWQGSWPLPDDWSERITIQRLLELDAAMMSHLVEPAAVLAHCEQAVQLVQQAPLGRSGNPLKDVRNYAETARSRAGLLQLVLAYRAAKQELGVVEFADQMALAVRLAETVLSVGQELRSEYRVVLLDEYQDTSVAQTRLLAALFGGTVDPAGLGHPVSAVGDPLQAIYGWRGASSANIGAFTTVFRDATDQPGASCSLGYNRRSGQRILDVANVIAAKVPGTANVKLKESTGQAPVSNIRAASYVSRDDELAALVAQVLAVHHESGTWADIAVLTRKNAALTQLYTALTAANIPAEIVGLGGLLARPDVSAVLATLRLLLEPSDNPSVLELLSGSRWQIGPRDLALLGERAKKLANSADENPPCLLLAIHDLGGARFSKEARSVLQRFATELDGLSEHLHEPALDLVHRVVAVGGYFAEALTAQIAGHGDGGLGLRRFLRLVARFTSEASHASPAALLAWLECEMRYGNELEQGVVSRDDSVKLLTVHKAKGLEWDSVLLPGLYEGGFPDDRMVGSDFTTNPQVLPPQLRGDWESVPQLCDFTTKGFHNYRETLRAEQVAAEDRLSYVAVTRAKRSLLVSMAYWRADVKKPATPSRLFKSIVDGVITEEQLSLTPPQDVPTQNPYQAVEQRYAWPVAVDSEQQEALQWAARAVLEGLPQGAGDELSAAELVITQRWHATADELVAERLRENAMTGQLNLPVSLTASEVIYAAKNQQEFARQLLRPVPQPITSASSIGSAFHAWLEQRLSTQTLHSNTLWDEDYLAETQFDEAGSAGADSLLSVTDSAQFRALQQAWLSGEYGQRTPLEVEVPFVFLVAGQQLRGRIDAVYSANAAQYQYQIVDWKTGGSADDMQLALYRAAFAAAQGIELTAVDAICYFVAEQRVYRPAVLPDYDALCEWIVGLSST
ncbi:MAG: ATP-dependent helicase [Propionibacteriaceae bacterium]|nr:ATP-dependent helicase [Propionibacteriaceae bacterium]